MCCIVFTGLSERYGCVFKATPVQECQDRRLVGCIGGGQWKASWTYDDHLDQTERLSSAPGLLERNHCTIVFFCLHCVVSVSLLKKVTLFSKKKYLINNNNKMVTYNAHFHAMRAQCADPWTAKRLQTLKQL
jgi:hypothetical protein